ncbi:hypothetical protein CAY60_021125 [Shouchella clausii]|nr:hypothetical protein [Shouchella clausii]ALA55203.1 hypothetical protein DB29_04375 [Shouchella clausii]MDP5305431.1 hypothetical protein [Shouchella clausii]
MRNPLYWYGIRAMMQMASVASRFAFIYNIVNLPIAPSLFA